MDINEQISGFSTFKKQLMNRGCNKAHMGVNMAQCSDMAFEDMRKVSVKVQ